MTVWIHCFRGYSRNNEIPIYIWVICSNLSSLQTMVSIVCWVIAINSIHDCCTGVTGHHKNSAGGESIYIHICFCMYEKTLSIALTKRLYNKCHVKRIQSYCSVPFMESLQLRYFMETPLLAFCKRKVGFRAKTTRFRPLLLWKFINWTKQNFFILFKRVETNSLNTELLQQKQLMVENPGIISIIYAHKIKI